MQKLVWQNSIGDSVDLTSGNYGITEWEGFSNASLNIQSQQVPFQDGAVFLDALMEQRELSVTLKMQDNNNLENRYRMRRELIHILNPKLGEGYLIYTNDFTSKRIKCVPQIPLFKTHNSNDSGTPEASLAWTACEPYWEDVTESKVLFDYFKQPIIENNGDIKVGFEADLIMVNARNVKLENRTTGKSLMISGDLTKPIYINTKVGEKEVCEKTLSLDVVNFRNIVTCIFEESDRVLFGTYDGYVGYTKDDFKTVTLIKKVLPNAIVRTITKAFGKYYIGGYKDLVSFYTESVYSSDLENFSEVSYTRGNTLYLDRFNLLISIGQFRIYTSNDGTSWDTVYSSQSSAVKFYGVIDTGELVLVAGGNNNTKISTDCVNWQDKTDQRHGNANMTIFNGYLYDGAGNKYDLQGDYLEQITEDASEYLFLDSRGFLLFSDGTYTRNGNIFYNNPDLKNFYCGYFYNSEKQVMLFSDSIRITSDYTDCEIMKGEIGTFIKSDDTDRDYSVINKDYLIHITNSGFPTNLFMSDDFGKNFIKTLPAGNNNYWKNILSDGVNQVILFDGINIFYSDNSGKGFVKIYQFETSVILYKMKYIQELKQFVFIIGSTLYEIKNGELKTDQIQGLSEKIFDYANGFYWFNNFKINATTYELSIIGSNIPSINFNNLIYIKELDVFFAFSYSGVLYISTNGIKWNELETFEDDIFQIVYNENYGCGFIFLLNGDVYRFTNTNDISLFISINDNILDVAYNEDKIFVFTEHYLQQFEFVKGNNIIDRLSADSELNIELIQGNNKLSVTSENGEDIITKISYRQKYIGV